MRDKTQPLFRDQFAGHTADSVSLVLNTHKSGLKILDELILPLGELAGLFFGELVSAIILNSLERGCGILNVITAIVHDYLAEGVVFLPGLIKLIIDDDLELS